VLPPGDLQGRRPRPLAARRGRPAHQPPHLGFRAEHERALVHEVERPVRGERPASTLGTCPTPGTANPYNPGTPHPRGPTPTGGTRMIFSWLRRRRRRKLLSRPFPGEWLRYLQQNVTHYNFLSAGEQAKLRDDLRVFIAEKNWEGCGGLRMTDEVK